MSEATREWVIALIEKQLDDGLPRWLHTTRTDSAEGVTFDVQDDRDRPVVRVRVFP